MRTSCPFKVMLALFRVTLASWSKTLGPLGAPEAATTASQNLHKH
jgi:hypothetical protein